MKSICCRLLIDLAAVVSIAFALVIPMPAMAALITLKIPGIPGDLKVRERKALSKYCHYLTMYRTP